MRTTLNLPEELLLEAMDVTHIGTKTRVIIIALQELIRRNRIIELKKFKGKIDLEIDMDVLRSRECRS
ncbi:MAG: type II toxin-antitoxin system VapB family antitoxin [Candidatus Fermentibacteria bacterium]|nr:type II toxin-antitoxin system VapB family antitoxin [Candidatus Fermentibacteria bacterium]